MALQTGKVDAHCAGIWATPARGRVMALSHPLFFSPTVVFARVGDNRFDYNLERINQPDITVALSDDDITTEIYRNEFPRAKKYELPQFAPAEELLLTVATKKPTLPLIRLRGYTVSKKDTRMRLKLFQLKNRYAFTRTL